MNKAQLALNRPSRSDLGADGGIQAGAGCRGAPDPGEVEPAQIVVEVFGGDPAASAQEGLDPLMQAVDGLDMHFTADALAGRQVQRLMADAQRGGAGRIAGTSIGDQQGVLAEDRLQHRLDGIGTDGGQDGSDGIPGPVGGHQDRHLLMRQAALHRLAATLAGFAILRIGTGLALFRDATGIVETLPRVLPVPGGDKKWYLYAARAGLIFGVASHRSIVSLNTIARGETRTNRLAPPPFSPIMARHRLWLADWRACCTR